MKVSLDTFDAFQVFEVPDNLPILSQFNKISGVFGQMDSNVRLVLAPKKVTLQKIRCAFAAKTKSFENQTRGHSKWFVSSYGSYVSFRLGVHSV